MYETRIESGGSVPQLDESIILQEKLQKLQIQGLSDEVLQTILANPQAKVDFVRDIDAVASQTPPNPSEISKMELVYIKGYGQEVILKDGSKMSFADLMKMKDGKEKEEIVNGLGRMDKVRIKEYELQLTNQTEKKIDATIEVANQRIEEKKGVAEVAIDKLSTTAANLANTVKIALSSGIKLTPDYREIMKKIIAFGKPPETVKYFQEVLSNPNNFSV